MRRVIFVIAVLWGLATDMCGQNAAEEAIAVFVNSDVEELDEYEMERLSDMLRHPLSLNLASFSELASSGLLTRYQSASLVDYRQRNGSVMSYMELSVLDGFSEDFVARIRPFVSLDRVPASSRGKPDNEVTSRSSLRVSDGTGRWSTAVRYIVNSGDRLSASIAMSRSLEAKGILPDTFCGSISWKPMRVPMKILVGDFNARFGQGLSLWNGMYLNSWYSPSFLMRRPSGVNASSSFTGTYALTGMAAELNVRRLSVSVMMAAPGIKQIASGLDELCLMPAVNVTYDGFRTHFGVTHYTEFKGFEDHSSVYIPSMKSSVDFSACIRGVNVFSELAYDWAERRPLMLCGVMIPVGEHSDVAALFGSSKSEYHLTMSGSLVKGRWMEVKAISMRRFTGTLAADVTLYTEPKDVTQDRSLQVKFHSQFEYIFSESLTMKVRLSERMRSWGTGFRTDVRSDIHCHIQNFTTTMRLNFLAGKSFSCLAYVEGGYGTGPLSAYLRQGFFVADDWEDRIYVYERDAPGCFNVPAMYGRGLWTSAMISWKPLQILRIYLRAAYTSYAFMKEKKPGKAELRLQCTIDF